MKIGLIAVAAAGVLALIGGNAGQLWTAYDRVRTEIVRPLIEKNSLPRAAAGATASGPEPARSVRRSPPAAAQPPDASSP